MAISPHHHTTIIPQPFLYDGPNGEYMAQMQSDFELVRFCTHHPRGLRIRDDYIYIVTELSTDIGTISCIGYIISGAIMMAH